MLVFAAACQDAATGPTALPEAQPSLGQGAGAPFYCTTQVLTPGGYRNGRFTLSFPQSALAPDGESMRYRFRATGKDGRVRAFADCVIPRTVPAVEVMNRRFGLPPRTGLPVGGGRPEQEMTVTSETYCSEDPTEGCTVVGDPVEEEPTCDINTGANCDHATGGGAGDAGGGGGTGGEETYDDSPPADDTQHDCHTWSTCSLDPASSAQKEAMTKAIQEHIVQSRCPDLYAAALDLVATTQVWEATITITDGDRQGTLRGDYVASEGVQHIWSGNFDSPHKWLPWVLAHEAAHAIHGPDEDTADLVGDSCLNFTL